MAGANRERPAEYVLRRGCGLGDRNYILQRLLRRRYGRASPAWCEDDYRLPAGDNLPWNGSSYSEDGARPERSPRKQRSPRRHHVALSSLALPFAHCRALPPLPGEQRERGNRKLRSVAKCSSCPRARFVECSQHTFGRERKRSQARARGVENRVTYRRRRDRDRELARSERA